MKHFLKPVAIKKSKEQKVADALFFSKVFKDRLRVRNAVGNGAQK